MKSINQIAQESGDTSANEAERIRQREAAVRQAWRTLQFNNDKLPTISQIVELASRLADEYLGAEFCARICECTGYEVDAEEGSER